MNADCQFWQHKKTETAVKHAYLIVALAMGPVAALAQTAPASGITLYGKLDLTMDTTRFSAAPGRAAHSADYLSNDVSYIGLYGSEDLGGGSRAYFKLESGMSLDTGASTGGSRLFDREAYIAYGGRWGALQAGSQFSPALYLQAKSDAYARHGNGGGFMLTQQVPGNVRGFYGAATLDNALQYVSPRDSAVSVRLLHAFSEKATAPRDVGRYDAASVEYSNGPWFAGVAYENQRVPGAVPSAVLSNRTLTAGLTYNFTVVKLFSYLMRNKLDGARDVHAYQAGVAYPFGASTIRATYTTRTQEDTAGAGAQTFALGYYYYLSLRTTLYTSYARLNNGTATAFGLWPSMKNYLPPPAAGGAGLPVPGQDVSSFQVGIRHTF